MLKLLIDIIYFENLAFFINKVIDNQHKNTITIFNCAFFLTLLFFNCHLRVITTEPYERFEFQAARV
jgi:hypothetical protein